MNATERARYIESFDQVLLPLGYRRRKRDQEWRKQVEGVDCLWIHLNFGLGVISPSLGVKYTDLSSRLPPEAGAVISTGRMLSSLSGAQYSASTSASELADDLLSHGLPELIALQDRHEVIRQLEASIVKNWPVPSASHRMRLLPLLLADEGRVAESSIWLKRFEQLPDQMIPSYAIFAQLFRSAHGA